MSEDKKESTDIEIDSNILDLDKEVELLTNPAFNFASMEDSDEALLEKVKQFQEELPIGESKDYFNNIQEYSDDHADATFVEADDFEGIESEAMMETSEQLPEDLRDEEMPASTKKTKKDLLEKMQQLSMKQFYIVAGVLGALIILMTTLAFVFRNRTVQAQNRDKIQIQQPQNNANNANYIFVSTRETLGDQPISIYKITVDQDGTVFYFDPAIDCTNLDFSLLDNNGNRYLLDYYYYDPQNLANTTSIRFYGLEPEVKEFTLTVAENGGESRNMTFRLDKPVENTPVKYVDEATSLYTSADGVGMSLDRMRFTSLNSTVHYHIHWEDPATQLTLQPSGNNTPVTMSQGIMNMFPIKSMPSQFYFEDAHLLLGRLDFEAVRNLDEMIRVAWNGVFRTVELHEELDPTPLFLNEKESQQKINIGSNTMVLERMARQGDQYILVLHSEDPAVYSFSGNPSLDYQNRIETRPDIDLVLDLANGTQVSVKGKVMSDQRGTDALFDVKKYNDLLIGATTQNMTLRINRVSFKVSPETTTLDLKAASYAEADSAVEVAQFIQAAFGSRLDYKSGKISQENIVGFTQEVIKDPVLSMDYRLKKIDEAPTQMVKLITFAEEGGFVYAVVMDTWRGKMGQEIEEFCRYHKVTMEKTADSFQIIKDVIVH